MLINISLDFVFLLAGQFFSNFGSSGLILQRCLRHKFMVQVAWTSLFESQPGNVDVLSRNAFIGISRALIFLSQIGSRAS